MKLVHNILSTSGRFSVIQASDRPFPNSGGVVVVFSNCQLPIVNCTSSTFHSKFSVLYSKFSFSQGFLYAPFGEITTEYNANFGNNVLPKYTFNAKELDEETGMYYYEARYYKPPVFTSRDPMFEKYFWMTPYAYCANNPVKYVDPSGEIPIETLWDLGNVIYDIGAAAVNYAKGDNKAAKSNLTNLGLDIAAVLIPYVPAGASKAIGLTVKGFKVLDKVTVGGITYSHMSDFYKSVVNLSEGERIMKYKEVGAQVAKHNGWKKIQNCQKRISTMSIQTKKVKFIQLILNMENSKSLIKMENIKKQLSLMEKEK